MKRIWISILLCTLLLFTACGKEPTNETSTETETSTDTPEDTESASELAEKSLRLATGMVYGEFQPVCALFSEKMKSSGLTEESLRAVWEKTVADMGKYGESMSVKETTEGEFQKIFVRLDYPKQDLQVLFVFNANQEIEGLWMKPTEKEKKKSEKQESAYPESEIEIGKKPVGGSLMLPKEGNKPPVVLLLSGSGPNDRDESIFQNRPFFDLAEGLAERGIATLRFDKRSLRYPQDVATVDDEILNDAREALRILRSDERTDSDRIFLLGHSFGGMVAPLLASEHPEIRGLISVASSPRELEDILYDQLNKLPSLTEEERKRVESERARVKSLTEKDTDAPFQIPAEYWRSLRQLTPGERAEKLGIPMLFLQGGADFQVDPEKDFGEWQRILVKKSNVRFRSYPELNHLMMKTQGKKDASEYETPGHIEPEVIQNITDWILGL